MALNVTLTAINAVVAVVTLPVITNAALLHFGPGNPAEESARTA